MSALDLTLAAGERHGWHCVLLARGKKAPLKGQKWQITSDVAVIRGHVASGRGIGLVTGLSGVAVLDFDDMELYEKMAAALGRLQPWATSPSGGVHVYVRNVPELVARMHWEDALAGEVQRGDRQQVCMPPSPYPGKPSKGVPPGGEYRWLVDPTGDVPALPERWRAHLTPRPAFIAPGDARGTENAGWKGESAEKVLELAAKQDGARVASNGVHFACSGCRASGRDRSGDNAVVFLSGRFTCAVAGQEHRGAIARQLNLGLAKNKPGYVDPMTAPLAKNKPGYVDPMTRPVRARTPDDECAEAWLEMLAQARHRPAVSR